MRGRLAHASSAFLCQESVRFPGAAQPGVRSAGHETTAKSLCWALLDILRRPGVHARVKDELLGRFGAGDVSVSGCEELPYLTASLKESMRLSPVTTVLQRELRRSLRLTHHVIPRGAVVAPSNYLAHRHGSAWERPLTFEPERFMGDVVHSPSAYFPFGGGRRKCLGTAFAMKEMVILIASVLHRCDVSLLSGADHRAVADGVTIGPKDGVPLLVRRAERRAQFSSAQGGQAVPTS